MSFEANASVDMTHRRDDWREICRTVLESGRFAHDEQQADYLQVCFVRVAAVSLSTP